MEYINIGQAEKEKSSSLWILNNSGSSGKQAGVINISIAESNGQVNTIRIPVTFIPVDITTQATKSAVLANPQFRRLLSGNMIRIVSTDSAEEMMQQPDAQAEARRLFSLGYEENTELQPNAPTEVRDMLNADNGNIGGFALNLAHNADGNEEDLVASLRANAGTLNTEEFKYIVNNSQYAKVKALAASYIVK